LKKNARGPPPPGVFFLGETETKKGFFPGFWFLVAPRFFFFSPGGGTRVWGGCFLGWPRVGHPVVGGEKKISFRVCVLGGGPPPLCEGGTYTGCCVEKLWKTPPKPFFGGAGPPFFFPWLEGFGGFFFFKKKKGFFWGVGGVGAPRSQGGGFFQKHTPFSFFFGGNFESLSFVDHTKNRGFFFLAKKGGTPGPFWGGGSFFSQNFAFFFF